MATLAEIQNLKRRWLDDPTWELEDTPGFEAHKDELKAWRLAKLAEWEAEEQAEAEEDAADFGKDPETADVIRALEAQAQRNLDEVTIKLVSFFQEAGVLHPGTVHEITITIRKLVDAAVAQARAEILKAD